MKQTRIHELKRSLNADLQALKTKTLTIFKLLFNLFFQKHSHFAIQ